MTIKKKEFKPAHGLNEIALVPSDLTLDLDMVDISTSIAGLNLGIPIFASAMDSVVNVETASEMGQYGAIGILNLEGVQTRYENPDDILDQIAKVEKKDYVALMQKIYQENDVKIELVKQRIKEIKDQNVPVIVSATPQKANELGLKPIAYFRGFTLVTCALIQALNACNARTHG